MTKPGQPNEPLQQFPANVRFKYPWRKYQQRVLAELEEHLEDNHLHIIAPPGSGKTVLGLEVAKRLNKPTLILVPTVAIRSQWVQRFCELFLESQQKPSWISSDIKNPNFLTVSTYQGLHAALSGPAFEEEEDDEEEHSTPSSRKRKVAAEKPNEIIQLLKAQNFGTIVVDEAHHLKNAWWQSLIALKGALDPTIVGLTATPPYDVSHAEWQRYIELNGPVDAEISVPELVAEGDLCPHQDYVYFSLPTEKESKLIGDFRERVQSLFEGLKIDPILIQAFESHPIYQNPEEQLEWIYSNIECYSACLIFLHAVGREIQENHLEIIGDKGFKIPELNLEWAEILLSFYLFKEPESFPLHHEHQEQVRLKLKRAGVLERRSISLRYNRKINGHLNSSISKLESIANIVDFERKHLRNALRMVILTDFIRKEFLVNQPQNELELNKIGILPIFEKLRRNNDKDLKIGVLTGSLIIIPASAHNALQQGLDRFGIDKLPSTPLPYDAQYLVLHQNEQTKHQLVHLITQLFQEGHIEVLIGTKSLLGEGWDAPAINALILASFVGSYVLSKSNERTRHQNREKEYRKNWQYLAPCMCRPYHARQW